jgi:hypothetical protein
VVFSVDEKPRIQALERTAPVLPMMPGVPERRSFDYERHGTTDLFATLNIATGKVISKRKKRRIRAGTEWERRCLPGRGAVMQMRSLRWNLVVWNPSAGPADPYGAPGFAYIAWGARARWQPIFVVVGLLLMVIGLMLLHSTIAFIAGVLMVGSSVGGWPGPHSFAAAMVRTWEWLDQDRANHW